MAVYDLGSYSRPVTCANPAAQSAFDEGLAWLYGYNHEAAEAAFARAGADELRVALVRGAGSRHGWSRALRERLGELRREPKVAQAAREVTVD